MASDPNLSLSQVLGVLTQLPKVELAPRTGGPAGTNPWVLDVVRDAVDREQPR